MSNILIIYQYYNRSDGKVVSVTDCSVKWRVFEPSMNAGFQCSARSLHRPAFYDAITGPTEFISIVNWVIIVNIPLACLPHLKEGKSLGILLLLL